MGGAGLAQLVALWTVSRCVVGSTPTHGTEHLGFTPVPHDWVIKLKGLGMSSRFCAAGHIKDPVPLMEKRRGLSPGGQFPPSFIHQVIIITGLNKLYNCRGGSRNSLRGGGGLGQNSSKGGFRVQVRGNFHILTSKKEEEATSEGGGG